MNTFVWSSLFETGLAEVDEQHRRLVELLNALGDHVHGGDQAQVDRLLGELAGYTVYHFESEEKLMRAAGLDARHVQDHCATHERFVVQVKAWMASREQAGQLSVGELLEYLANWLVFHILGEDQAMGRQVFAVRAGVMPSDAFTSDTHSEDPRTSVLLNALHRLYADLVHRNDLLAQAQSNLTALNASLEQRVEQRTAELAAANQQIRAEQQKAIATEKMASLGRMVAGFAHEVNTPVGIAVGAVSQLVEEVRALGTLMQRDEVSEAEVQNVLSLMAETGDLAASNLRRAATLVQSFKRTAVDQTSEAERNFKLGELIDDVVHSLGPLYRRTSIAFTLDCPADLVLHGVPGVLAQILTNLCTNAYVHAFAEGARGGNIRIAARLVGSEVEVRFIDDGAGMEAAHMQKAFEPFFTTNRQGGGSGLGLFIVYSLVTQSLGGTVECRSNKGIGTTFLLRFPYVASQQMKASP